MERAERPGRSETDARTRLLASEGGAGCTSSGDPGGWGGIGGKNKRKRRIEHVPLLCDANVASQAGEQRTSPPSMAGGQEPPVKSCPTTAPGGKRRKLLQYARQVNLLLAPDGTLRGVVRGARDGEPEGKGGGGNPPPPGRGAIRGNGRGTAVETPATDAGRGERTGPGKPDGRTSWIGRAPGCPCRFPC